MKMTRIQVLYRLRTRQCDQRHECLSQASFLPGNCLLCLAKLKDVLQSSIHASSVSFLCSYTYEDDEGIFPECQFVFDFRAASQFSASHWRRRSASVLLLSNREGEGIPLILGLNAMWCVLYKNSCDIHFAYTLTCRKKCFSIENGYFSLRQLSKICAAS